MIQVVGQFPLFSVGPANGYARVKPVKYGNADPGALFGHAFNHLFHWTSAFQSTGYPRQGEHSEADRTHDWGEVDMRVYQARKNQPIRRVVDLASPIGGELWLHCGHLAAGQTHVEPPLAAIGRIH